MKNSKKIIVFILIMLIVISLLAIIDKTFNKGIDFTNVEVLTLEELHAMNPDEPVKFEYGSSGISRIKGTCADFKVNNSNDALKVLYSLQDILAICDINNLKCFDEHHDDYDDIYTFKQYINGIEVISGTVTVLVHADTKDAYIVNSYCDSALNIDTSYKINKKEAKKIVKNEKKFDINKITKTELVIYNDFSKGNVLAWYIETDSFEAAYFYIDANNGEILYVARPVAVSIAITN